MFSVAFKKIKIIQISSEKSSAENFTIAKKLSITDLPSKFAGCKIITCFHFYSK